MIPNSLTLLDNDASYQLVLAMDLQNYVGIQAVSLGNVSLFLWHSEVQEWKRDYMDGAWRQVLGINEALPEEDPEVYKSLDDSLPDEFQLLRLAWAIPNEKRRAVNVAVYQWEILPVIRKD